jgi:4-hydroxy-tetrahydrodipicolinate synthase
MAQATELGGICPIVATPFTEAGEIDFESLRRLVRTLAEGGCHGMVLFGVAGEFYKLSDDERARMIAAATDELADYDVPLLASITSQSSTVAAAEAAHAEREGIDGLMVLPPSTLDPSPDDQYDHLRQVAEAVDIPIMVQYAPETAGSPVPLDVFVRLSDELSNVRYYKIESEPPGRDISELVAETPDRVDVLVGYAGINMIESFDRGAVGVIPGCSLFDVYLEIYDRYRTGDREGALALHDSLVPFLNHARQEPPMLVHYEKTILVRRGVIDTATCRPPAFHPDDVYDDHFEYHYDRMREYTTDLGLE